MILQSTIMPEQASEMAWHVDNLIWFIAATTGITGLGVYAALLYFCVAYRRKTPNQLGYSPTPRILGSHKLELAWTVIPLLLFLGFFAWGAWVYNMALTPPADAPEVFVVGKQWMWKVQYPGGQRVILGQNSLDYSKDVGGEGYFEGMMVLPVGKPVKITLTSEDVIHDFGVPAFRQKIDAVPGRYTSTWYLPTKTGTYDIFCDQYCGTNHSLMVGKIMVVEQGEYQEWLDGYWKTGPGKNAVDGSLAHQGRQLFQKLNCIQCHDPAQSKAPPLEGIAGLERPIRNAGMVPATDQYLRDSIRRPRYQVREGWEPIMPHFGPDKVSEEELRAVITYIKSLKPGDTPRRTDNSVAPVGGESRSPEDPKTGPKSADPKGTDPKNPDPMPKTNGEGGAK